jgi:hypothetical protein
MPGDSLAKWLEASAVRFPLDNLEPYRTYIKYEITLPSLYARWQNIFVN